MIRWIFLALCLSSCSLFSVKSPERLDYFTAENGTASSQEIRENLTKTLTNAGGYYKIGITPLTAPYLKARSSELSAYRGLSASALKEREQKEFNDYLDQKFCVEIQLEVIRHFQALDLMEWEVTMTSGNGEVMPAIWREISRPTIITEFIGAHGKEDRWQMEGIVCTQQAMEITPKFEVTLKAPYTPWPFPKEQTAVWAFHDDPVENKKEKRTFKRYRGY